MEHIAATVKDANMPSIVMGVIALVILLVSRRLIPKFPMAICVMAAGAVMSCFIVIHSATGGRQNASRYSHGQFVSGGGYHGGDTSGGEQFCAEKQI